MSRRVLNISREGDSTTFLGSPDLLCHSHSNKVLPCVSMELPMFQFLLIAPSFTVAYHRKESAFISLTPSLQMYINNDEILSPPSLLQAEQSQFSQPFLK